MNWGAAMLFAGVIVVTGALAQIDGTMGVLFLGGVMIVVGLFAE